MNIIDGQDIESLLATQITAEIAHEIDNELCLGIYNFANVAPIENWSKTPDLGVSRWEHYNGFSITLAENAATIFQATEKFGANFAIAGTQAAVVFRTQQGFNAVNTVDVAGPHKIGTTADGLDIYVNPAFDPDAYVNNCVAA